MLIRGLASIDWPVNIRARTRSACVGNLRPARANRESGSDYH
jgi:hypothetical protein